VQHICHAAVGVPRRRSDLQVSLAEGYPFAVFEVAVRTIGTGSGAKSDLAAQAALENRCAGHMAGMNMGLQGTLQLEAKLAHERAVAWRLLVNRIDENGFAARVIPQQVGVGRRLRIKELSEYQQGNPLGPVRSRCREDESFAPDLGRMTIP